jgi:hypothetical protein
MVLRAKGVASRISSGSLSEAKTSPLVASESANAFTASPRTEQDEPPMAASAARPMPTHADPEIVPLNAPKAGIAVLPRALTKILPFHLACPSHLRLAQCIRLFDGVKLGIESSIQRNLRFEKT